MDFLVNLAYIVASILFIYGLKMLGRAETARRGNLVSALGMLLAIVVTLLAGGLSYLWILVGLLIGGTIGLIAARTVQMTAMPEMVALFNGSGGLASLLTRMGRIPESARCTDLHGPSYRHGSCHWRRRLHRGSLIAFGKALRTPAGPAPALRRAAVRQRADSRGGGGVWGPCSSSRPLPPTGR